MRSTTKRLRGFAIVSAIFILVVLAALGAFIMSISTSQQIGSALDVQGVRAYQAARAGLEWGLYKVQESAAAAPAAPYNFSYGTPAGAVGSADPNTRVCPGEALPTVASTRSFVPAATTLSGFAVTVVCTPVSDGSGGPRIYSITATACSEPITGWTATTVACPNTAPGNLYIERRLEVAF
ncbi:MAG: pilus assembly PilX N-terminal domain-containing protein [Rhodocyclales bacterium]|nr:pilus assembly PilX N-terminal domain-containing protein [Rhodocyclales bacterium]